MSQTPNEDLFESTKMTFGEHLEELRICLVRALAGLALGTAAGLFFAGAVVRAIQGPLESALEEFYLESSMEELSSQYNDAPVPKALSDFMESNKMVFESVYWEVSELERVLDSVPGAETKNGDGAVQIVGTPGPPSATMIEARVWKPLDANVTSLSAHEPFMIWLKAALITGALISSPWLFWQIWSFVASGLYPHEKGHVYMFVPFSLGLFLSGAALAFFFVFKPVLNFLFGFNRLMGIDPDPRISEWMSFVLFLPLGFGVSFQLPLVMLMLERIGVMSITTYLEKWRIAVLVICVIAMLLTPADPISMLLMACPLTLLYFGGIALCYWMPKRRNPFGDGYDPQ